MINKPVRLNREFNRDHSIKALERRESINHGSTLGYLLGPPVPPDQVAGQVHLKFGICRIFNSTYIVVILG